MRQIKPIPHEIERKWLVSRFPSREEMKLLKTADIDQVYLSTEPFIRVSKSVARLINANGEKIKYKMTVKGEGTLNREEIETPVEAHFFYQCRDMLGKLPIPMSPIKKDFMMFEYEGHNIECSLVDKGAPWSFRYCEVEFENEAEALLFRFPHEFFGDVEEVTEVPEFKMKNFWNNTRLPGNESKWSMYRHLMDD